jgi:hypothetical protein
MVQVIAMNEQLAALDDLNPQVAAAGRVFNDWRRYVEPTGRHNARHCRHYGTNPPVEDMEIVGKALLD